MCEFTFISLTVAAHSLSHCTPLKSKGNFESRNSTVAYHHQAHIMAETKKIPLAQITTVHLLQPIKCIGTWRRVCDATGAGQYLEAVNGKYEAVAVSVEFLLQNGSLKRNPWF